MPHAALHVPPANEAKVGVVFVGFGAQRPGGASGAHVLYKLHPVIWLAFIVKVVVPSGRRYTLRAMNYPLFLIDRKLLIGIGPSTLVCQVELRGGRPTNGQFSLQPGFTAKVLLVGVLQPGRHHRLIASFVGMLQIQQAGHQARVNAGRPRLEGKCVPNLPSISS